MRIGFDGRLVDQPRIRAGFIGCGSHAFRNIYPTFQLAPVQLVATCDLDGDRAAAFARQFGAERSYANHRAMLEKEKLDAVFIVTGYDERGRPQYPALASDCLAAGCHVWTEKPPAASCREIDQLRAAARGAQRQVMVGFKKMFFPANRKARELMLQPDFGQASLVTLQYPLYVPTAEEFSQYGAGRKNSVTGFLDHLCHPASLMVYLLGMPASLIYSRSLSGAGAALFSFPSGAVASLAFTNGSAADGGMERTMITGQKGRHIIVDNNTRVELRHNPPRLAYGKAPDYFQGGPPEASAVWEPEFSLGQLYNKGLVLLGYYDEVNEFASSILERRDPERGTLEHAWQVTRIFEAFAEGPDKRIGLAGA